MEQQNSLTLGSLFDGSGGFPLGGLISGITPLWSSEIEPFPILLMVTYTRRPRSCTRSMLPNNMALLCRM